MDSARCVCFICASAVAQAGGIGVAFGHAALDVDSAAYGVDDADKFHQHAVAGRLDRATAMPGDLWIDVHLAARLEPVKRAFLIGLDQATVASDIDGHNRGKATVHAVV
jgi:hypothetical protein